ncbi:hypothetical protein GCM10028812_25350 [Ancylobacter sonchi]
MRLLLVLRRRRGGEGRQHQERQAGEKGAQGRHGRSHIGDGLTSDVWIVRLAGDGGRANPNVSLTRGAATGRQSCFRPALRDRRIPVAHATGWRLEAPGCRLAVGAAAGAVYHRLLIRSRRMPCDSRAGLSFRLAVTEPR